MYCIDVLRIAQYLIWYCERVVTVCVFLDANSSLTRWGIRGRAPRVGPLVTIAWRHAPPAA